MRNLEAKFRLADRAGAHRAALVIGFAPRATLIQRDTFFTVAEGKLKLREEPSGAALIHYRRAHAGSLELSDYAIVPIPDPAATRAMLAAALGVLAEVRKSRVLLMRRNVRLHLDRVDGLGDFGEIEAVLGAGESAEAYRAEVAELLAALAIVPDRLIDVSYFELARRA
ncbi:MAG: class IV adenylate cyclase [Candidatus Binataceae bacterium]|nr:class IV adenylate cyclase [Candidatus Binataceae bacterium]